MSSVNEPTRNRRSDRSKEIPHRASRTISLLTAIGCVLISCAALYIGFFVTSLPMFVAVLLVLPTAAISIAICIGIGFDDHLHIVDGSRQYITPAWQRLLAVVMFCCLLGVIVSGMAHNYSRASGEQDTQAAQARNLVLRASLDQEDYLEQAGQYADNMASLAFIDPGLATAAGDANTDLHLGSLDGMGFSIRADTHLGGFFQPTGPGDSPFTMTYSLRYQNDSFNTSCDAPGHTGCTDSRWTLPDRWQQKLQGPAVDAAGR